MGKVGRRLTFGFAVVVILGLFQILFRYQYVPERNDVVMRIDRVTGSSCTMPCTPTPPPPTQTPFDLVVAESAFTDRYHLLQQRAIHAAQSTTLGQEVVQQHPEDKFRWSANNFGNDLQEISINASPDPNVTPSLTSYPTPDPLIDVCYCDEKRSGWHWAVHTDTGEVFNIDHQR